MGYPLPKGGDGSMFGPETAIAVSICRSMQVWGEPRRSQGVPPIGPPGAGRDRCLWYSGPAHLT